MICQVMIQKTHCIANIQSLIEMSKKKHSEPIRFILVQSEVETMRIKNWFGSIQARQKSCYMNSKV